MDQTENKENMEAMEEEQIVVITDDEGNELYFREEMVVPVGKKKFRYFSADQFGRLRM